MRLIGVTGGVGAGKSSVLDYLHKEYGAVIVLLDDVSRAMLATDGPCYDETIEIFGRSVVREDRSLDRAAIAERVFSDSVMMEKLNALVHPAVRKETEKIISRCREEGVQILVLEAALLIEQHYDEICDELWYIYASEDVRAKRLAESRGYDMTRIRNMMASQLSEEAFEAGCSVKIDNGGEPEKAFREIDERLSLLIRNA